MTTMKSIYLFKHFSLRYRMRRKERFEVHKGDEVCGAVRRVEMRRDPPPVIVEQWWQKRPSSVHQLKFKEIHSHWDFRFVLIQNASLMATMQATGRRVASDGNQLPKTILNPLNLSVERSLRIKESIFCIEGENDMKSIPWWQKDGLSFHRMIFSMAWEYGGPHGTVTQSVCQSVSEWVSG